MTLKLDDMGVTKKESVRFKKMADLTDEQIDEAVQQAVEDLEDLTQQKWMRLVSQATNAAMKTRKPKPIAGTYETIVIVPPWPMEKIEREVRPNQGREIDYPTMTENELAALHIPADEHCHLWLWTTHRFLPMAFRLLSQWGFGYVCLFVWHKPGGFQPVDLPQYNCEFAVYARKGSPTFVDTKAFSVCFGGKRGKHSEKPDEFYDMIRRVTAGPRLDTFNRRPIDGFDRWGNELDE